ncbi:uncharacterized protein LTR77_001286 [Saxophila tyrrhenica]|uniref:Uncharacterized protein n=1 Tax=Saxophila tyrrhenica TaxID=1690608 RepID=A0AAV9PN36_9PEZI|nr:hypothetical protein LTR77_001286 [Saxophila tyrrhenica]
MAARRPAIRGIILTLLLALIHAASADQVYYFTGAIWLKGQNHGSYAVPAQCPADHPIGCSDIGAADYCCPSGQTCQWADSKPACCPNGCTCTGFAGAGAGGYHATSWYATTTEWQPQTTYVAPAPQHTSYVAPAGAAGGYQQYCSTLYAHGPNLPTTAQGDCGTILVMDPDDVPSGAEGGRVKGVGYGRLGVMVGGLQVLGGMLFLRRW